MDKRNKAEQFRKTRKNFFKRGYKIGIKSEAEMFILVRRHGKSYTFTNTNLPFWPSQAETDRNATVAKTAADFQLTSRRKKDVGSSPATSGQDSALSALGIKTPTVPQLELCSRRRVGGRKQLALVE